MALAWIGRSDSAADFGAALRYARKEIDENCIDYMLRQPFDVHLPLALKKFGLQGS